MPESRTTTTKETYVIGEGQSPKTNTPPPAEVMKKVTVTKKKRVNWVVIGLAAALLGLAVWYLFLRTPAKAPLVIRYTAVDMGSISKGVTATGTLQATTTVQVGSQVSGMIKELYADFNTHVKKGQLLAQLDPSALEATLTQVKANLSKAEADLANAKKDESRSRDLLARQLIAQADYDLTHNKLLDAQATVQQQAAIVRQAEVNLAYTSVRSPISGVVVSRNVDRGQTVAAGLNVATLFVIAEDLTSMQVAANVDEADIGSVQEGQPVKFTVDAYPGEQFEGAVKQVRINSVTQQNVVTYTVIISTANPNEKLLPGMTATVSIINDSRENVMRVPISATRFVPPPEFIAELGPAAAKDSTLTRRRPQGGGDSTRRGNWAGGGNRQNRPQFATIYVKSKAKTGPAVVKSRAILGLSDANYAEILNSTPALHTGDSVVVAAFTMQATTPAGTSPINSRPGGGGGGGRGGGGR
jgi:HlyD family secretion protein